MNSQAPISQEAKCRRTSYSFHCFYCNVKILEFQRNSKIFVTFTLKKILTFQLHRYTIAIEKFTKNCRLKTRLHFKAK